MSKHGIIDLVTFLFFKKCKICWNRQILRAQCHGSPPLPAQGNCFDEPAVLIPSDLLLQRRSRRSETTSKRKFFYSCILFHACTVSGTLQLPQKFCEIQTYWASLTQNFFPLPMTSLRLLTVLTQQAHISNWNVSQWCTNSYCNYTLITFSANEIAFREDTMF